MNDSTSTAGSNVVSDIEISTDFFTDAFDKVVEKVSGWGEQFIAMLPNMAVSIILFLLFYVLARLSRKGFSNVFRRTSDNEVLNTLFSTIVYYSVIGLGLFIILGVLQLERAVTSLLAGVGVVGLALGFAFQDIAANFISGIILAFRVPFQVGHVVQINDIMGEVSRTNLRVTVIRTFQNQEVYVPNKDVLQSPIYNYSILGQRRVDIPVGISYGDDLDKVERVVTDTISSLDMIVKERDLIFDYYEFGNSSINFYIRFYINYPGQPGFLSARHQAVKAIKKAFDEHDITIPFPIRTLDFGIKGGVPLYEKSIRLTQEPDNE